MLNADNSEARIPAASPCVFPLTSEIMFLETAQFGGFFQ
jgi:hypothetical protein